MKYIKLYLPVILLVIYWLLFELFKTHVTNEDYSVYIVTLFSFITMVICAIKSGGKFMPSIIMLIVYDIINFIMFNLLNKSNDFFLSGMEYTVMTSVFVGTSIVYFIIMTIRSLSQDKKSTT